MHFFRRAIINKHHWHKQRDGDAGLVHGVRCCHCRNVKKQVALPRRGHPGELADPKWLGPHDRQCIPRQVRKVSIQLA